MLYLTHELKQISTGQMLLQGIWPDLLHIMDLQVLTDIYASALLTWTDDQRVWRGTSRDARLELAYGDYAAWCVASGLATIYLAYFIICMCVFVSTVVITIKCKSPDFSVRATQECPPHAEQEGLCLSRKSCGRRTMTTRT